MYKLFLGFTVVAVLGASFWGCSSSGSGSSVASRNRVAFIGDRDTALTDELFYNVEVTGGGSVVKASGTLVAGGNVTHVKWSPNRLKLAYRADQDTDDVFELYVVDVSTGTPGVAMKVSGTLVAGGDVRSDFEWSPDSTRVAYIADQDVDEQFELYTTLASGTSNALNRPSQSVPVRL